MITGNTNDTHVTTSISLPPDQVRTGGWAGRGGVGGEQTKQNANISGCQGLGMVVGMGWGGDSGGHIGGVLCGDGRVLYLYCSCGSMNLS